MLKLKESTKPLHDSTEQHQFQGKLAHGKLTKERYIKYLEQLYLIHSTLADYLEEKKNSGPIQTIVKQRHLSTEALTSDLKDLGKSSFDAQALVATKSFLELLSRTKESCPAALLGALYVLEGSTHGAKYMAKNLREGMGFAEREASSYFDRYQENQMKFWLEFKKEMNEESITGEEEEATINIAKATFEAFIEIGNEILEN